MKNKDVIFLHSNLAAADATQESTKKLQASATIARDEVIIKLKDQAARTRNFVRAAFIGNKEMLVQFKPIDKGKTSGNGESETPAKAPAT